ncbi:MAG TPA: twin-arginine translocase TatA/TatE family subunit [Tepidisphaeraceae bacterium]|nr:twin-arginine translocase TatA/TatE family subunit [Tepidisphaeraceae bacterium]
MHMPSLLQWVVIVAIGLLIFGKRLPEVGHSLGKGIVEFKKGLKGIGDDVDVPVQVDPRPAQQPQTAPRLPLDQQAVLPKTSGAEPRFDPYTGKPLKARFDPYTGKPIEEGQG